MGETLNLFVSVYITFFFLLTPFFVLTMFLALTKGLGRDAQRRLALRVTAAVVATTFVLYFFGNVIFEVFGITLDAFRIGAGALLFLSAASLVRGDAADKAPEAEGDISVVPLAIPITVGPATTGALLVMGAGDMGAAKQAVGCAALFAACASVGAILWLGASVERALGRNGLSILTKITGLVLAALAAQIVFTGVKGFLG